MPATIFLLPSGASVPGGMEAGDGDEGGGACVKVSSPVAGGCLSGYLFSSMICLRSSRSGGIGSRRRCMRPSSPRKTTVLCLPWASSFSG